MDLSEMLDIPPYSLPFEKKDPIFLNKMIELTNYHIEHSEIYRRILSAESFKIEDVAIIDDIPFLPVGLFKTQELVSIPRNRITRVMTSSGTSGQTVSKVFLDPETSKNQTRVLSKIIGSFIGTNRLPLLILDSRLSIKDRKLFSARGAGIMGFSVLGKDMTFALDENMQLDLQVVEDFLARHKGEPVLLFGYTFMIWKHFYNALVERNIKLHFDSGTVLFHVGGWKKLKDMAVDSTTYRESITEQTGIHKIYDYYGMAEQLGSVFVACEYGHLHASIFSEILIRDETSLEVCKTGQKGILQVMSVIPHSYPGHSLLTEDEGMLLGIDDCPCGRKGKYFEIYGRLKNSEIRGCSDTYASQF